MKKVLLGLSVAGLFLAATVAFAAEKEQEVKGQVQCLKCQKIMADAAKCTMGIVEMKDGKAVEKDGKKVYYIFAENDHSKALHPKLCQKKADATIHGTVKEKDGKKELTIGKIDLKE